MQPLGTPCWIDLMTDTAAVKPFYTAVLGWRYEPLGDTGWFFAHTTNGPVAAIGPGEPREWQVLLGTGDIQGTVAQAESVGGAVVLTPGQVGDLGWAAHLADPSNTITPLWQAGTHAGFDITGEEGCPVWFEVYGSDLDAMRAFFEGITGLESHPMEGMPYRTVNEGGRPRFGIGELGEMAPVSEPGWMVYFSTPDVDATVERVTANHGSVEKAPFDTPFGRMAFCRDPSGSRFAVVG